MDARKHLPLNALRAFEAVGRLGRMTLAANELGVTHAAISRKIRQLESLLGVKLLSGPKNRLGLTEAGRTLVGLLAPAFNQIEAAVCAVVDKEAGIVNVSCLATFMMRWLIPRLYQFNSTHELVEVRLSASDQPISFERELYDIAIRVDDHRLPEGAHVTKLFPELVGPVVSPMLLQGSDLAQPADLGELPLLCSKTRPQAWQAWAYHLKTRVPGQPAKMFEHIYFMLEAATAGLGACIAPWPLVIDDIAAGRLVAPFGFAPSGLNYVAARKGNRSRKAEEFCEWLAQEAKSTPVPS
ncbi:MAG: LysR family transcriptional regulator [Pseudolabrys sp.]|nr:LysR family transcriptional regulator [Pseudolabrys sp.]